MPESDDADGRQTAKRRAQSGDDRPTFASVKEAVADLERWRGRASQRWTYYDSAGEPVGLVVRWDGPKGKDIRPVSRNGRGWILGGMAKPRPLYGLPDLIATPAGSRVYVVEGEKAADAARALGLIATTSPHGSASAHKADWSPLKDRDIVILPDRDEAGETYAAEVAELAQAAGARAVRIVRLAERWAELPAGGDLADVLENEGGDVDAIRTALDTLATEAAPSASPGGEVSPSPLSPARFHPFPTHLLPSPIFALVEDGAAAIGCDESFIALPMLAALASAIGNSRRIRLKGTWTEPAILWCAIVGESGTAKSPALELALRWVRQREHAARKAHAEAVKTWEAEAIRWKAERSAWEKRAAKRAAKGGPVDDPPEEPERPTCARTWTADTTPEALASLLNENPRGLLLACDELAGWFAFDRYRNGKGGEAARWLEIYGGRPLIVDRKTSGSQYVPRAAVSIAGGIQPDTLRRALVPEYCENGLAARLLFAMPPRRPRRWTDADIGGALEDAVAAVFDHLYALEPAVDAEGDPEPRLIPLNAEAEAAWIRFYNDHGEAEMALTGDEAAASAKLGNYAARLALVVHLTRAAAGDATLANAEVVDVKSIEAGVGLVGWFAGEAERVYRLLGGTDEDRERDRLVEWIEAQGGAVTVRELQRGPREYRDKAKAQAALKALEAEGRGTWEATSGGRTLRLRLKSGDSGDGDTSKPEEARNVAIVATVSGHCQIGSEA